MQETGNIEIVIRWHNCICMSICICRCIKARGRQQGHYDSGGIVYVTGKSGRQCRHYNTT